jgi:hypothetical protein
VPDAAQQVRPPGVLDLGGGDVDTSQRSTGRGDRPCPAAVHDAAQEVRRADVLDRGRREVDIQPATACQAR